MMLLTGILSAQAASTPPLVTGWIRHNATILDTVDPAAPLDDLAPLGQSIGNAKIVGLGESVHGPRRRKPSSSAPCASLSNGWVSVPSPGKRTGRRDFR
jgi:hypothetical protein